MGERPGQGLCFVFAGKSLGEWYGIVYVDPEGAVVYAGVGGNLGREGEKEFVQQEGEKLASEDSGNYIRLTSEQLDQIKAEFTPEKAFRGEDDLRKLVVKVIQSAKSQLSGKGDKFFLTEAGFWQYGSKDELSQCLTGEILANAPDKGDCFLFRCSADKFHGFGIAFADEKNGIAFVKVVDMDNSSDVGQLIQFPFDGIFSPKEDNYRVLTPEELERIQSECAK